MDIPIQAKIEKSFTQQFGKLIETAKSSCSPSTLTSKAKVAAFSRNISSAVSELVDPSKWFNWPQPALLRGMARNMDIVAGYDYHMISFLLPPVPFPIIVGPVPIPFVNVITARSASGIKRLIPGSKPVFVNSRKALSGPNEVTSLIPHQGPLPFLPIITILGNRHRTRCEIRPSESCHIFINGKRAVRHADEGFESCGKGKIIMFAASGSVKTGSRGGLSKT